MNCHDDSRLRCRHGDEVIHVGDPGRASLMDKTISFGEYVVEDVALKVKLLDVFNGHPRPHVHDGDRSHIVRLNQAQLLRDLEGITGGTVVRVDAMDQELRVRIRETLAASQKWNDPGRVDNPSAMGNDLNGNTHQKGEENTPRPWASSMRGHQKIKRLWLMLTDYIRNLGDQKVHRLTVDVVEKVNVECLHINSLANVKVLSHLPKGVASTVG
jgi:hypothetical protein